MKYPEKIKNIICLIAVILSPILASGQMPKLTYSQTKEITVNYKDSTVIAEVLLFSKKLDIKDNLRYFWYSNYSIHSNIGGYNGDLLQGTYTVLGENSSMIRKGNFINGLKDRTWKEWYLDGTIKRIEQWDNGVLDGETIEYDNSGNTIKKMKYNNGKPISTNKKNEIVKVTKKEKDKESRNKNIPNTAVDKDSTKRKFQFKDGIFKGRPSDTSSKFKIALPKFNFKTKKADGAEEEPKIKLKLLKNKDTSDVEKDTSSKKVDAQKPKPEKKNKKGTVINAGAVSNKKKKDKNDNN